MPNRHNPLIDLRYWVLINLISIFGTNTGDLMVRLFKQLFEGQPWLANFKHIGPFPLLLVLFLLVYFIQQRSQRPREFYFWGLILIIRTAATNVADALTDELSLSLITILLGLGLPFLFYAIYWQQHRPKPISTPFVPDTSWDYWGAMIVAGVLGTVAGDALWQWLGLSTAAWALGGITIIMVITGYRSYLALTAFYWLGVLWARIAGTAAGDWLAKNADRGGSGLTLYSATLVSGVVFVVIALVWQSDSKDQVQTGQEI